MPELPHLAWPLRTAVDATLAVIEQDTQTDVEQTTRLLLNTPRGTRLLSPLVGVSDYTFTSGISTQQLAADLSRDEPRATFNVTAGAPSPTGHQDVNVSVVLDLT